MNNEKGNDFVGCLFQKAFNEQVPSMPDLEEMASRVERISDNDLEFVTAAGVLPQGSPTGEKAFIK